MINSATVVVFITQSYIDKVRGEDANDNCKLEFNYAKNHKSNNMIAVPMESQVLNASSWLGPVGAVLGSRLYKAHFAFNIVQNKARFETEVEKLCKQISSMNDPVLQQNKYETQSNDEQNKSPEQGLSFVEFCSVIDCSRCQKRKT